MKVLAIVPAYNEEQRIRPVLQILKESPLISRILVVDDGSEDDTSGVAEASGAEVLKLSRNLGKGGAMQKGLESIKDEDLILFIDADLIGLNTDHLESMIGPFHDKPSLQMVLGIFKGGRLATDMAQKIAPQISGQRAITSSFAKKLPDLTKTRYGVEVAINRFAKEQGVKNLEVVLENLSHVMKEEKLGKVKGFRSRLKMYAHIIKHLFIN